MATSEAELSPSRAYWRQLLLPRIQTEVAHVVKVQKSRTKFWDNYNKFWSFLGSHTTYVIGLPLVFWLGEAFYARHLTMLMGIGLVLCNIVKDALCLPRPASPPVERLSKTHHLEYGFPSSHSVNALNLPLFTVYYCLNYTQTTYSIPETILMFLCAAFVTYSISYSRIYCGMHCMSDIIGGYMVGILLLSSWLYYLPEIEHWMTVSSHIPLHCLSVMALFLFIYPTPLAATPTFDDSVAFSFTLVGIAIGTNQHTNHPLSWPQGYPANFHFDISSASWGLIALRTLIGVAIIVCWRALAKTVCKIVLPPVFNFFSPSLASTFPESGSEQKRRHEFNRFDVDTATRIVVYVGVGMLTSFLGTYIFGFFGVNN